jgi:hypothetical protein
LLFVDFEFGLFESATTSRVQSSILVGLSGGTGGVATTTLGAGVLRGPVSNLLQADPYSSTVSSLSLVCSVSWFDIGEVGEVGETGET